jgi:hypothetical protein
MSITVPLSIALLIATVPPRHPAGYGDKKVGKFM